MVLLALINNGFVLLNGSPDWQQAVSGIILLVAVVTPFVDPYNPKVDSNLENSRQPPSREHIMGTDNLGRDVLSMLLASSSATWLLAITLRVSPTTNMVPTGLPSRPSRPISTAMSTAS